MKYKLHFTFESMILLLLILFSILFIYYLYKKNKREHFTEDSVGDINDNRWVSLYSSQNSIFSSNIGKYFQEKPKSYNTDFPEDIPIPLQEVDLALSATGRYGDNGYRKGLINYQDLVKEIKSKETINQFGTFTEKLLKPIDKTPLEYKYELEFEYEMLNRKTWIDRWKEYNPQIKQSFSYSQIRSPIEDINKCNMEFLNRTYKAQQTLLNKRQLVMFGILPFDIFRYKIIKIEYNQNNEALYSIIIMLFRETDLFMPTLAYKGFVKNNQIYIFEPEYVGMSSQGKYLGAQPFEKEDTYQIINKNFTNNDNTKILSLTPDQVVKQMKDYQESYKLNNQYACFNTDPDVYTNPKKSGDILVRFGYNDNNNTIPTREMCESYYDWYGRPKQIGILDKPCKTDNECPFYQSNRNYSNQKGKCGEDGKCELPVGMKELGFRYFSPANQYKPLCYNCKSDKWNISTPLENCCDDQFDKKKYPFLDGPDYAYQNDYKDRYNHYIQQNCHKDKDNILVCKN
jgi:cbb3-type cytochrome oxidase subunit 3